MSRSAITLPPLAPGAALRWDVVRRLLPKSPGDLLEIGCGQGAFAARLAACSKSFLGLEPDPDSYQVARDRLATTEHAQILNARVEDLPPEQKFDTVCAFEVIEHLEDDTASLSCWVSRLRPGGTLLVSAPAHSERLGPWDELGGHYRRYDPDQMAALLSAAGLDNVRVNLYGYPLGPFLERIRNIVARHKLDQADTTFQQRTASSGRQLQPDTKMAAWAMAVATRPFLALQHFFPNRGVALLASAKLPRER